MRLFLCSKIFKGTPINFVVEIVVRGNAVQISSNFPAKRLSIYRKIYFQHLFNYLNDFQLTN